VCRIYNNAVFDIRFRAQFRRFGPLAPEVWSAVCVGGPDYGGTSGMPQAARLVEALGKRLDEPFGTEKTVGLHWVVSMAEACAQSIGACVVARSKLSSERFVDFAKTVLELMKVVPPLAAQRVPKAYIGLNMDRGLSADSPSVLAGDFLQCLLVHYAAELGRPFDAELFDAAASDDLETRDAGQPARHHAIRRLSGERRETFTLMQRRGRVMATFPLLLCTSRRLAADVLESVALALESGNETELEAFRQKYETEVAQRCRKEFSSSRP
jgi:hypothetical protein